MAVARQPGGLKTLSDEELLIWIENRRAGLARAERDKTGRSSKARRGWRESVEAAEAELAWRTARKREPDR
jgi:hypothetical protein